MSCLLRDRPASTPEMLTAFSDEALLRAALTFETMLARAQADVGLIPSDAAETIAIACAELPDVVSLAEAAAHAGTLAIPLVALIRERIADPEVAKLVHKGATSQDLADTALMLQAKTGAALVLRDASRLAQALAVLAQRHAATPMLGRTLLQAAQPITFGLKAAGWLQGVASALARFERETGAIQMQLGGATGSLAGLDGRAGDVAERLAARLGLPAPETPWHARREGLAGLASSLAILTGAVGKIAGDIALMAQTEVAEAFEPKVVGRGGSSTMAHKRNPTGCQVALSASIRAPHLAATILSALPQQHERGLGGWQVEGPVLAELFELAHGALAAMAIVVEGLEVDADRMAVNLAAARVGSDIGEAERLVARALNAYPKDR
ncbi:3-carboxy-cis,cis-muconate cycloisomerase [Caulobacter vibrioides]|uniref:3-carboxy-cis,cis-muconate cycloisomerase n=2 Tax=Caulobacter vibrioides TaxID=155892 RepID=Q9A5N7_CAUVC|nr:3-carboxy-cis,cis-muconate cycloisomerase [Caulobacter vibrioides]YP_002517866.1 3-carboxy-cis,cis-muconate cycloisomerase [Caulobacter vibrioides NA1000]AAK24381.1 3-carboxy-cis,cis-muconate cycloisomerase [Caulobacter vibrioides CB15]ACL95958.1 3-carboxy-cis,cis-muconate cycloisomerase [Caulobacter vibrioides NA1000]ATC29264.1 3-carboxy-cis,cis-muconate cycloisomerase [Caulobacter vibrioides]QXZ50776.1 3-carboxy-cis,cis-muconate cycloisomerase [Caulobacter vibrioides]